jgi:hypothetical protein
VGQTLAACGLCQAADIDAACGQQVEGDKRRRGLGRELCDPRCCRVQSHLQRIEVQAARRGDDDLTVDHAL